MSDQVRVEIRGPYELPEYIAWFTNYRFENDYIVVDTIRRMCRVDHPDGVSSLYTYEHIQTVYNERFK